MTESPREPRAFPGDEMMAMLASAVSRPQLGFWDDDEDEPPFDREGPVAVVCVDGPLMQRGGWWWDGYESISARFDAALADAQTGAVLLKINSPGGVAAGCFEAVKAMRQKAETSGKRVFAYADEMACSAAYAVATVAEEIWLPPSGEVGSVGVIATYLDATRAAEEQGVRFVVLASGKQKADGHPFRPLTPEVEARLQERIDYLAGLFFALVADARGMTPDAIQALEAGVFAGQGAVASRLADRVGSFADCLAAAQGAAAQRLSAARGFFLRGNDMNPILQALCLPENATEAEAVVAAVQLREQGERLSSRNVALESRVSELEAQVAQSVPKAQHAETVAALQSTIDAAAEAKATLEKRALAAEAKVKEADTARITAKVESFVGPKLTVAEREPYLKIALRDEAEFDALMASRPDLGVTGDSVIGTKGNETRRTDSGDAKVARLDQFTAERMKLKGCSRLEAMRQVMLEHPELCNDD